MRRITPLECERLMGFPDHWTDIPGASDGVRYRALGNSVAIPCVEYILSGIAYFWKNRRKKMYIYPDNLKAKATMWLWELKDLAVIGILVLISVFGFAYAKLWFPLIFAGVYAFLTIQVEDISILKFIRYACAYFLVEQQSFEWRYRGMVADE